MRLLELVRRACWNAFLHNAFAIAKGAAYSSILTLFPALLVLASVLAATHRTEAFVRLIASAVGAILPPGSSSPAMAFFHGKEPKPVRLLLSASSIMLLAASGVMISWMEGFRNAYQLQVKWGFWKERLIALSLVVLALLPMMFASVLVAFGSVIETWMAFHMIFPRVYIFLLWTGARWLIAILTSIAVLALIYHFGVPRTLPWYRVLPGAVLATAVWFPSTLLFGWYVTNFATYGVIYGQLGAAIALLVWLYIISIIVLVGAELNALLNPRLVRKLQEQTKADDTLVWER